MDHMQKLRELRARTDIHFNCAQALIVAFSDACGLSDEEAYHLGSGFGSGMHSGETCGALSASTMILGLATGDARDHMARIRKGFKATHVSTQCRELLAASAKAGIPRKQHCDGLVFELGERLEEILASSSCDPAAPSALM